MTVIQGIGMVAFLFVWAVGTTWVLTKLAQIRREMAEVEARTAKGAALEIKLAADQAVLRLHEAALAASGKLEGVATAASGKLRSEAATVATDLKSMPSKVRQSDPVQLKASPLSLATEHLQEAAEAVATELKGTAKKADAVATELKGTSNGD